MRSSRALERLEQRSAAELVVEMQRWIESEDRIERELGQHLASMDAHGMWDRLGYRSLSHYGEARLGLARTTVQNRVALARSQRRHPELWGAYTAGELGFEAALLVLRILRSGVCGAETSRLWIEHARAITIKRLRDELRMVRKALAEPGLAGPQREVPAPLTDAQWHASLAREPGFSLREVWRLGAIAAERVAVSIQDGIGLPDSCTDVFLNLRLPGNQARDFWLALLRPIEATSQRPSATIAARWVHCRVAPPVWVALLRMLEEYVTTWDDPLAAPKRASDAVYIRDGWRCSAPGCTSRANLEDHHLVYRARGGSNATSNRVCVCRFHHRLGEHGGLASCRGVAPLQVRWRLGRPRVATWYLNERRLASTGSIAPTRMDSGEALGGVGPGWVC